MILEQIVESTRERVAEQKASEPAASIKSAVRNQEPPRDFAGALRGGDISLIAEVKRASPSKGLLSPNLDAASLARAYSASGAAAISVLTEPHYFHGSFADLDATRAAVDLPLLCKDFIVDRYQVYKARAHGADAVLLITAVLTRSHLRALLDATHALGMTALIEVHNRDELEKALELSPGVIGVNNRNLGTFDVDLETTFSLRPLIPAGVVVVSESGIRSRDDVVRLEEAGVDAILVGEALVTSPDPAAKISGLMGRADKSRAIESPKR